MKKLLVILFFAIVFVGCKDKNNDVNPDLATDVVGTYIINTVSINGTEIQVPAKSDMVVARVNGNVVDVKINLDGKELTQITKAELKGTSGAVTFAGEGTSEDGLKISATGNITNGSLSLVWKEGSDTLVFTGKK